MDPSPRIQVTYLTQGVTQLAEGQPQSAPPLTLNRFAGRIPGPGHSELDAPDGLERHAHELLDTAVEEGVHVGKNPVGLAAAALYAASRLREKSLTQSEVSEVADISEVTIRNRHTEIIEAGAA